MTKDSTDSSAAHEVIDQPFGEILADKYLSYALSTIMSRSLPDVRDGMKPVHRRLLYAMYQLKLNPETPPKKSARVVGDVIGKYHPHGDTAVYDAMVRLAQDFSVRYPLVDGQGNFGNIDGDNAAAMRYTESRLTNVALLLLEGIGVAMSFFVLTLFFAAIGWLNLPEDPVKVVVGWLMLAWWGCALGMFLGTLSHQSELVDKFWHPMCYLLFPLSGSAFLVDALPPTFREWILYLPMVHGIECVRDGFFGSLFTPHYDLGYMAMINLAFTFAAMVQIRRVSRNLVPA